LTLNISILIQTEDSEALCNRIQEWNKERGNNSKLKKLSSKQRHNLQPTSNFIGTIKIGTYNNKGIQNLFVIFWLLGTNAVEDNKTFILMV
jgi:carboxypeptidase C (cathepsin A)